MKRAYADITNRENINANLPAQRMLRKEAIDKGATSKRGAQTIANPYMSKESKWKLLKLTLMTFCRLLPFTKVMREKISRWCDKNH